MNKEELYYKKLLTKYKRLMVFDHSTDCHIDMVKDIVNCTKADKRPIIIISRYVKAIEEKIEHNKLIIMYPRYRDIASLKGIDNHNKILIFRGRERDCDQIDFILNLELAMTANNIMIRQGENPLIIIDGFQELYNVYDTGKTYDYFVEVILNELSSTQNLVLISSTIFPYGQDYDEPSDFYSAVRETDAMAFAQNFISNKYTGTLYNVINEINTILKNSNDDMTDMIEEFEEISTDEMRLEKGLVFDFRGKTIEDFKGRPD